MGDTTQNIMDPQTGMRMAEALGVQLDVQCRLHDQLEIQRTLQVRIEEQGRRLQKMFDDQLMASGNNNNAAVPAPDPVDGVVFPATTEQEEPMFVDEDDAQLLSPSVAAATRTSCSLVNRDGRSDAL